MNESLRGGLLLRIKLSETETQHFDPPDGIYVFMASGGSGRKYLTTTRRHVYRRGMIEVKVPKGFVFDGGSIPWMFLGLVALIDLNHRRERAFLFHDFGYRAQDNRKDTVDILLYSILREDFARWQQPLAYLLWLAVRLGGGRAWKANAKRAETFRSESALLLKIEKP